MTSSDGIFTVVVFSNPNSPVTIIQDTTTFVAHFLVAPTEILRGSRWRKQCDCVCFAPGTQAIADKAGPLVRTEIRIHHAESFFFFFLGIAASAFNTGALDTRPTSTGRPMFRRTGYYPRSKANRRQRGHRNMSRVIPRDRDANEYRVERDGYYVRHLGIASASWRDRNAPPRSGDDEPCPAR